MYCDGATDRAYVRISEFHFARGRMLDEAGICLLPMKHRQKCWRLQQMVDNLPGRSKFFWKGGLYEREKRMLSTALALMLAGSITQASWAETRVDFSNSEGFGLSEDLVQINNILVTNVIENPFDPAHPELIEVSYNVPFRFDLASLHLIPELGAASTSNDANATCATLTVNVSDASTGEALDDAVVTINDRSQQADSGGTATFDNLPGGSPLVINAAAAGHDAASRTIELECGSQGTGIALNPTGWQEDAGGTYGNQVRVVLTWGEEPRDLDSHLTGPMGMGDESRFHVFFANRTAEVAELDVDDTTSFGPETITIMPPEGSGTLRPGLYRYSVYQYAGGNTLATSGAQVQLYIGDSVRTFDPPQDTGYLTGPHDLWTVFELMVAEDGNITVYPVMTYDTSGMGSGDVQTPISTATGMGSVETGIDFARLPGK